MGFEKTVSRPRRAIAVGLGVLEGLFFLPARLLYIPIPVVKVFMFLSWNQRFDTPQFILGTRRYAAQMLGGLPELVIQTVRKTSNVRKRLEKSNLGSLRAPVGSQH